MCPCMADKIYFSWSLLSNIFSPFWQQGPVMTVGGPTSVSARIGLGVRTAVRWLTSPRVWRGTGICSTRTLPWPVRSSCTPGTMESPSGLGLTTGYSCTSSSARGTQSHWRLVISPQTNIVLCTGITMSVCVNLSFSLLPLAVQNFWFFIDSDIDEIFCRNWWIFHFTKCVFIVMIISGLLR